MGTSISQLPNAATLAEADQFEIAQSGVSRSITKQTLRRQLFSDPAFGTPLPIAGDSLVYNGTDWLPRAVSDWRTVPQSAYSAAAVASSSTITFFGGADVSGIQRGANDYFTVGLPVRVLISGTNYYGICTGATDTTLTIAGAALPTATAITSLSVGTVDMIKQIQLVYPATTYNTFGAAVALPRGCNHRWRGKPGHFVSASVSHMNTSATTVVNFKMNNGANVLTTGVIPAAGTATTQGAYVETTAADVIAANAIINDAQTITVVVPTAGGTADFLTACLTFVVP